MIQVRIVNMIPRTYVAAVFSIHRCLALILRICALKRVDACDSIDTD